MVTARHLEFSKVQNFNCRRGRRAKFCADWLNRSGDMAIFQFFKMAVVRHLLF